MYETSKTSWYEEIIVSGEKYLINSYHVNFDSYKLLTTGVPYKTVLSPLQDLILQKANLSLKYISVL